MNDCEVKHQTDPGPPPPTSALNLVQMQYDYLMKFKEELTHKKHRPELITTLMEQKILDAERFFEAYKEKCFAESKVNYWLLTGRIYNLSHTFVTKAIDAFSKAVKLDPKRVELWNSLGECYWLNKEQDLAQKCFENALKQERNPISLRNLSIIARNGDNCNMQLRRMRTETGITLAKEAVGLDITDGVSWTILGNAYISAFFSIRPDPEYAYKAISAYKQAEKSQKGKESSDLFHNKYIALKFVELYHEALCSLTKALEIAPNWVLASEAKVALIKYLDDVNLYNYTNGRLKPKKIALLRKSIGRIDLGPYMTNRTYRPVSIANLEEGANSKLIIYGKVTWNLQVDDTFPFTFGFLDSTGDSVVVTVYNLADRKGFIIGDAVAIPDPHLTKVNFTYGDKVFKFFKVRVNSPSSIILNGKPTPLSYCGPITFRSATDSH